MLAIEGASIPWRQTLRALTAPETCAVDSISGYCAGSQGIATVLTVDGSSLNLMYSVLPFGKGIVSAASTKPSGTVTGLVKSGSVLTASIRKSLSPLSVHCFSAPLMQ